MAVFTVQEPVREFFWLEYGNPHYSSKNLRTEPVCEFLRLEYGNPYCN